MRKLGKLSLYTFVLSILIACSTSGGEQAEKETITENETATLEQEEINDSKQDEEAGTSTASQKGDSNQTNQDDEQTYMKNKLAETYFREVDIEVNYANSLEYEAEIDDDHGTIKAKIENDFEGKEMESIGAFDIIFANMKDLQISPDSNKDEVFEQVITSFELPNDYIKIEVEITFEDGTQVEFEEKK